MIGLHFISDQTQSYRKALRYYSESDVKNAGGIDAVVLFGERVRSDNELQTRMRMPVDYRCAG